MRTVLPLHCAIWVRRPRDRCLAPSFNGVGGYPLNRFECRRCNTLPAIAWLKGILPITSSHYEKNPRFFNAKEKSEKSVENAVIFLTRTRYVMRMIHCENRVGGLCHIGKLSALRGLLGVIMANRLKHIRIIRPIFRLLTFRSSFEPITAPAPSDWELQRESKRAPSQANPENSRSFPAAANVPIR